MSSTNTIEVTTIAALSHREAMNLQAVELDRAVAMLRKLDADQWATQTNCPDWDVRRMWLHVLGACETGASMRENMHQLRLARERRKDLGVTLEAGRRASRSPNATASHPTSSSDGWRASLRRMAGLREVRTPIVADPSVATDQYDGSIRRSGAPDCPGEVWRAAES